MSFGQPSMDEGGLEDKYGQEDQDNLNFSEHMEEDKVKKYLKLTGKPHLISTS